jgi:hypothetical protein
MEVFEVVLSKGKEESWSSKTGDSENFFVEALQDDAVS